MNTLNREAQREIAEAFETIAGEKDVDAVVLCAQGRGFSAGADLNDTGAEDTAQAQAAFRQAVDRSTAAIYHCPIPVIAAVHGFVVGLGLSYASLCDVIIASEDARFILPEVKSGIVGSPFYLRRIFPDKLARYYLYTGETIPMERLIQCGAVLKVVSEDQLMETALEIAGEIAEQYSKTIRIYKKLILEEETASMDVLELSSKSREVGSCLDDDPIRLELLRTHRERRRKSQK